MLFVQSNLALFLAAMLTLVASALHFACLMFGAPLFRILGAGDAVVTMAEHGHSHPYLMALVVGVALLFFAGLSLSLAGVVRPIPYAKYVLASFAIVLTLRGLLFPFLKPYFIGNSDLFWYLSSAFCLALAALIFKGLRDVWN
jgi:hypothetical protein